MNQIIIHIEDIQKTFEKYDHVFSLGFSLDFFAWEFVSLRWPNGCGKSTLLHLCAWLDTLNSWSIIRQPWLKLGYVFQNYKEALLPWLTVQANIAYPLIASWMSKKASYQVVSMLFDEFEITIPLDAYPHQLSWGQQQLVNILRSYIYDPDVLFMDEPFASLDYQTTQRLYTLLQKLWLEKNKVKLFTIVLISHSVDEVIQLSSRIIILNKKPTQVFGVCHIDAIYPRTNEFTLSSEFIASKEFTLWLCAQR